VCCLPEDKFDFLGYTFGRCYAVRTGRAYIGTVPSRKRVQRTRRAISDETGCHTTWLDRPTLITKLNRMMVGWANYFCLGPVSKAYRAIESHARYRLRKWLGAKHKQRGRLAQRYSDTTLHDQWGLVRLAPRTARFPWAKA
jgi:RNA-directed DNA polymerase